MSTFMKQDIEKTDDNMLAWLEGRGMVVSHWGTGMPADYEGLAAPEGMDLHSFYSDPETVAAREDERLSDNSFPLDMMPICIPDLNTLPIALYLGAEPRYAKTNIWYEHTDLSPENNRKLLVEADHPWLSTHKMIYEACVEKSGGRYFVGLPAVVTNLDVLSELRGAQDLMMDLVMHPEWVHEKLEELYQAFLTTYDHFLPYCTDGKGWSTQGFFMFRGPGKIGLGHCDTAALISPGMFGEFVIPYLRRQCEFLDYSLYHVDGPEALRTVDHLLEVEGLTALEYTPGPQVPEGGDPCWFDLYKKIKKAGKGVQAVGILPGEVKPLLDAVGPEGMYLMINFQTMKEVEEIARVVEEFRA